MTGLGSNTGRVMTSAFNYVQRLSASAGTVSNGAGNFDNNGVLRLANTSDSDGFWPGGYPTSSTGFAGIQFADVNDTIFFGWLRLKIRNDSAGRPDKITIVDWAYEDENFQAIHVGAGAAIPEPTSLTSWLGLLAAGATGVTTFRRRRPED